MKVVEMDGEAIGIWIARTHRRVGELICFLDDLDAVAGHDADTGTNAQNTLSAIHRTLAELPPKADVTWTLRTCADAALSGGEGVIGVLVAAFFDAGARVAYPGVTMRPVDLLNFLSAGAKATANTMGKPRPGTVSDILLRAAELENYPQPFEFSQVASIATLAAQDALVDGGENRLGFVDPGGAVFLILLAELAATIDADPTISDVATIMLKDLAMAVPGPGERPTPDPLFEVDYLLQGQSNDAQQLRHRLDQKMVDYAITGWADPFGYGTWKVHARLDAPLYALPNAGRATQVTINHANPSQLDTAQLQEPMSMPAGVRMLERRVKTVKTIRPVPVIALVRTQALVEGAARCGASVIFDPGDNPAPIVSAWARLGEEALVLPCDAQGADTARAAQAIVAARTSIKGNFPGSLIIASTSNDLHVRLVTEKVIKELRGRTRVDIIPNLQVLAAEAVKEIHTTTLGSHEEVSGKLGSLCANFDADRPLTLWVVHSENEDPNKIEYIRTMMTRTLRPIELVILKGQTGAPTLLGVSPR